jgi:hypothetical protein
MYNFLLSLRFQGCVSLPRREAGSLVGLGPLRVGCEGHGQNLGFFLQAASVESRRRSLVQTLAEGEL